MENRLLAAACCPAASTRQAPPESGEAPASEKGFGGGWLAESIEQLSESTSAPIALLQHAASWLGVAAGDLGLSGQCDAGIALAGRPAQEQNRDAAATTGRQSC